MKLMLAISTFFCLGILALSMVEGRKADAPPRNPLPQEPTLAENKVDPGVEVHAYGTTRDGERIRQFTITNRNRLSMQLINYGAIMTSLNLPDNNGQFENVLLTCPDLAAWETCQSYFGATVGRYCNRIAGGRFSIDGTEYQLATNDGPNHLHGGERGFDKVVWEAQVIDKDHQRGVRFHYTSADGEEGYPGELQVVAEYLLNDDNELIIDFKATTDQATHVNLTNHNYWNLGGHSAGTILDHQLQIESDQYLPTDDTLIPTGEIARVADTPFDFSSPRKIGERLREVQADPVGYDLCYALRDRTGELRRAATVVDPQTGRKMEIWTTQPGLQFYSGNFLDGSPASGGYPQYTGFCLETQHFPDSPNQSKFPSTLLQPGQSYHQRTVHKFSVQ